MLREEEVLELLNSSAFDDGPRQIGLQPRCCNCLLRLKEEEKERGVCCGCLSHRKKVHSTAQREFSDLERELKDFLSAHVKVSKGKFDALVLFSGGKDSFHMINYLRDQVPNLRLLALFVDNHFVSPVTERTLCVASKKLPCPFLRLSIPFSIMKRVFQYCFLNYHQGQGGYFTVDRADGEMLFDIARMCAAKLRIPLILSGLSKFQCEEIVGTSTFFMDKGHNDFTREDIGGFSLRDMFEEMPRNCFWDAKCFHEEDIPQLVFPLYAMSYDEVAFEQKMEHELSLGVSKGHPLLSNHSLFPAIIALDYQLFGRCSFEEEFAMLVRRRESPRSRWLKVFQLAELLVPSGRFLPRSITAALACLDLSPEMVGLPKQQIMRGGVSWEGMTGKQVESLVQAR